MTTQQYKTRKGVTQVRPVMGDDEYRQSDNQGFCLACGMEAFNVEPDARCYPYESCSEPKVYGLEELLMMGLLIIEGEK